MAAKRPSLTGRGMEILFGEQGAQPNSGKMRHSAQSTRAAQARWAAELTAMLEAEALSARGDEGKLMGAPIDPAPGRRSSFSPPPASAAGQAGVQPRANAPAPLPEAGPEPETGAALQEAPECSPEGDAVGQEAGTRLGMDDPEPPDTGLPESPTREAEQRSRPREEREVTDFVGAERREALWDQITVLYREVPIALSAAPLQAEALQLLREAQDLLMERPRQFDVAQYKVGQVRSIIVRRKNTVRWTNSWGWAVFAYQLLWVFVLAQAILLAPYYLGQIDALIGGAERYISPGQLWNTAAWGGVGGVLASLYGLYWHAAKLKDFDKQYVMWYVVQPVAGLIIGALVYAVVDAGFLSLISGNGTVRQLAIRVLPYTLACVASFRQRFILEIVDRLVQVILGAETKGLRDRAGEKSGVLPGGSVVQE